MVRQGGVLKKRMVIVDYDEGNDGDYQDNPGYSLDPRVREGERFGKEEGSEANVFDLGWRKAPI